MEKARVNTSPVAANYARADERIIEVSHPLGGCLISISPQRGVLSVHVYRADPNVMLSHDPCVRTIYDTAEGGD
ncbi:MAG: hypothetical protein J2P17_12900 [Mycobacterium sp.]|nr:hypothetical protein [Mycobacterium sp.]